MLGAFLRFPRAMAELARISEFGVKKYKVVMGDMTYLDQSADYYLEKIGKHLLEEALRGPVNEEDGGVKHAGQIAWNALARLERMLKDEDAGETQVVEALTSRDGNSGCYATNDPVPLRRSKLERRKANVPVVLGLKRKTVRRLADRKAQMVGG
jgi:hypothetical protein